MTTYNHEQVGKALQLLRQELYPYVEWQMQAVYQKASMDLVGKGRSVRGQGRSHPTHLSHISVEGVAAYWGWLLRLQS